MTTGGAAITSDPVGVGYCFVKATIDGLPVGPVTVTMTRAADGSWTSAKMPKLYVPVYINRSPSNVVVLPLSQSTMTGVTLSSDGNCIGSYNPSGVTSAQSTVADGTAVVTCQDQDYASCQRWHTAGSLGGYVTLKEADQINIQVLSKSLCVLLTGGTATTNGGRNCATDSSGNIVAKGDFCSTTDSAGGCADSDWLAATIAASAAKITTGADVPACNGSTLDAGPDAR